ncbi:MAG: LeuA family protein [Spirochaetota bacterium]
MSQESMWKNENYWVSPFNYIPEVREQLKYLPKRVQFHDVTMRDGEQSPGVVFRKEDKVKIAGYLDEVGVDRIEVALPAVSEEDVQAVKDVVKMRPRAKVFVLSRVTQKDIDLAVDCGVDGVILEMPAGTPRLTYQFANWDQDQVIEKTLSALDYAKEKGLEVVLFPMDVTRSEPVFFERYLQAIADHRNQPDAIGIVDTTGCLIPQAAYYMTRRVIDVVGCRAEIHTHNDFELGISTPIAAVAAGAEVVHCSVAGLGERTGNTTLEVVSVALKSLLGVELSIDFSKLNELAHAVMKLAGLEICPTKSMTGSRTYTRESGMGINLIKEQPLAMFAVNPAFLGREASFVIGKKSGELSIDMKLAELGMEKLEGDHKKEVLKRVKNLGINKKQLVTDEEFKQIVKEVTGK